LFVYFLEVTIYFGHGHVSLFGVTLDMTMDELFISV